MERGTGDVRRSYRVAPSRHVTYRVVDGRFTDLRDLSRGRNRVIGIDNRLKY
jgi:hypothetical protein